MMGKASWRGTLAGLAVRAGIVYGILWGAPFVFMAVSRFTGVPNLARPYWNLWNPATAWVGTRVIGFADPAVWQVSGGSDLPFYWALVIVQAVLALIVGTVWNLLSHRPGASRRLAAGALTAGRYFLGAILIDYGAAKVIITQFPAPTLENLVTPLGDFAPYPLLWQFMGASPFYTVFAGLMEFIPGVLLFYRRTAVLGAVLGIAALGNVLALNLGYDVPVKLVLLHLILLGLAIALPEVLRFLGATTPLGHGHGTGHARRRVVLASIALILIAGANLRDSWIGRRSYGDLAPRSPLYGIYDVVELTAAPDSLGPAWQWATVVIPARGRLATIRLPDRSVVKRRLDVDSLSKTIVLTAPRSAGADPSVDTLRYSTAGQDLDVSGSIAGVVVVARLRRLDERALPLLRQPLRWVSDQ
jgi:hypothetical protein